MLKLNLFLFNENVPYAIMFRSISKQHALITGGSRGIGATIADILAKNGIRVTILSQNENLLKSRVQELNEKYPINEDRKHDYIAYNLTTSNKIEESIREKYWNQFKDINILINCAGKTQKNLLMSTASNEINDIISVNLTSPIVLSKLFIKNAIRMKDITHPFILINIASIVAKSDKDIDLIGASIYTTSKAGLVRFTESIKKELEYMGKRKSGGIAKQISQTGIHVLLPGYVADTAIGESVKVGEGYSIPEASREEIAEDVLAIVKDANHVQHYVTTQADAVTQKIQ